MTVQPSALPGATGPDLSDRGPALASLEGCRLAGARLLVKNLIDRVSALALLTVLLPVFVGVAAAVQATSRGPVLFRQERVGRHGRPFTLLKFRTMDHDADARRVEVAGLNVADGLLFKIPDDPRVTRVGQMLRRWSLDELPQFWNVLRGDMSLVGPRPLPVRADQLVGTARRRLQVKPGLTGPWQVSGRSELSWRETVRIDAAYVDQWSFALDLKIIARTPAAVVRGRGAV